MSFQKHLMVRLAVTQLGAESKHYLIDDSAPEAVQPEIKPTAARWWALWSRLQARSANRRRAALITRRASSEGRS